MISVLTLLGMLLSYQENNDISVLVLRDGRHIATIGPYSLKGDWVHFTLENRAYVKCHLDKVNLPATDRENEKLQKILKDVRSKRELYDEVEAYKRGIKGGSGSGIFIPVDEDERLGPTQGLGSVRERYKRVKDQVPEKNHTALLAIVILYFISCLAPFGVEIFLQIRSFYKATSWGMTIMIGNLISIASIFIIPFFSAILFGLEEGSLGCSILILYLVFAIALFIVKLTFIIKHCYGIRLRLIVLWFLPTFYLMGLFLFALSFGSFNIDWSTVLA